MTSSKARRNIAIIEAWRRLPRTLALSFTARPGANSRTGWAGTGTADVCCEHDGGDLRFIERGTFIPAGSDQALAFNNVYCWRLGDDALSLSHQRFGRDRPVWLFDLVADGDAALCSAHPHACGADLYHGRLTLAPSGFTMRWRIQGPAKDETLVYRYVTRESVSADDSDTAHHTHRNGTIDHE